MNGSKEVLMISCLGYVLLGQESEFNRFVSNKTLDFDTFDVRGHLGTYTSWQKVGIEYEYAFNIPNFANKYAAQVFVIAGIALLAM